MRWRGFGLNGRAFEIDVAERVALDIGAAAGGFTRVLLKARAARVYAVDSPSGRTSRFLPRSFCVGLLAR
jgi:predicted rRNA methylase YqxC with S4 and FtsJ domains